MRNLRNPQLERGEVRIEDIKLDHKCRDDMPTLLGGLQYLYSQETLRERLFFGNYIFKWQFVCKTLLIDCFVVIILLIFIGCASVTKSGAFT